MLPILRNGVAGLAGLDPAVIEAADGVGMTPRQRLCRVEAPLAAPVVMAGIRTAAVWTIGAATLSTSVGQTSLGNYIFSGLQTENWIFVLFGCVALRPLLALVVDQLLGLIETGVTRRDRRASMPASPASCSAPALRSRRWCWPRRRPTCVGAKNFSEQFILAELMAERLAREGATAERKEGLGSAVVFRALAGGDIDVYVDYSGTLWTNVMERRDVAAAPSDARGADALDGGTLRRQRARRARLRERLCARHAARAGRSARRAHHRRPRAPRAAAYARQRPRIPEPAGVGGAQATPTAHFRGAALVQSDLHVSRARRPETST